MTPLSGASNAAVVADTLRQSLVPSSVQELDRRGFRAVKVLPGEAVNRLIQEAQAARAEALFLREQVAEARLEQAAAERRAAAARLELAAARDEAAEARHGREAALRQAAEAEEAFAGARRAASAAEEALAQARRGFEAQLRAVMQDPLAFLPAGAPPERKGRKLALRRAKDAVRRMAQELRELRSRAGRPDPARPPGVRAEPVELVFRRSLGFGLAPAAPPVDLSKVEARLQSIEAKLEQALAARPAAAPAAGSEVDGDGVPSKFGPGKRAGLKGADPHFREKNAILRHLLEENVRLRRQG